MAQLFRNRTEAGERLAAQLMAYADRAAVVVLGLPRGGVPVAAAIAHALHAPLDVLVVRKLGSPGQEELAMGALAAGGVRVLNESLITDLAIPLTVIEAVTADAQHMLERRERLYRGDRSPLDLGGRIVILVDDGIATGMTLLAAVAAVRRLAPARIVVAAAVVARESCAAFYPLVDELVWVLAPEPFYAVGLWYDDFAPTSDAEVCALLAQTPCQHDATPVA